MTKVATGLRKSTSTESESTLLLAKTLAKTYKGRYMTRRQIASCVLGNFCQNLCRCNRVLSPLHKSHKFKLVWFSATCWGEEIIKIKQTKLGSVLLFLKNAMICKQYPKARLRRHLQWKPIRIRLCTQLSFWPSQSEGISKRSAVKLYIVKLYKLGIRLLPLNVT